MEQAKEIATTRYDLKSIESNELRHLTEQELNRLSNNSEGQNPVYYVFNGTNEEGEKMIVYISSIDKEKNFVLKKQKIMERVFNPSPIFGVSWFIVTVRLYRQHFGNFVC